ncbi:MAG: hypothetical protein ACOCW8_01380 [bacterium]
MRDGSLIESISGEAKIDGRRVYYMSTGDGESFNSNSNQRSTDDLSGLNEKMKEDLVNIYSDPLVYSSN